MEQIKRGEIYYANLCPVMGSEQGGIRPVVILQNDKGNLHSTTTIVAPITGELDKPYLPTHVIFKSDCMKKESMVLLEQIRTIDKSRLGRFVGEMDDRQMKRIDKAILISLGLDYLERLQNENKEDINNSAFYYSVNMLRHLLKMNLITEDEYNRIVRISSEYYSTKIYCV